MEEDDELIGADENIVLEEEDGRDEDEDEITTNTGLSGANTNTNKKNGGEKKQSTKLKKKVTLKRRKTGIKKSDIKVGYSEGAEENKGESLGDSQTTFNIESSNKTTTEIQKESFTD